ncbi:hypothetical protein ACFFMM_12740 [Micromonospora chaiyaphumensis]|uniref:Uncharacterized protein n=1 Tax=Micromonospora chaiyaphumensis TaxID=307119 RepID=A0A1C4YN07_9ACTN|nr:hypothetical protein [Micromonospora chaiyaphumensis]SCF22038.1 hypothetical protein GA0070214_10966 [Micromonospora chaiyaphumensis]
MSGFDEYAALLRELSTRQRGGERAVAAEAERRRTLQSTVDQLGRRLAAQGQRLDQLGQAINLPMRSVPAESPDAPAVPVGAPSEVEPAQPSTAPAAHATGSAAPVSGPVTPVPGGAQAPGSGGGVTGGAAAAPGRPGVGAYPEGTVPGPRVGDPAAELAAAGRLADEADRHGELAELLARRPVLLPTWSAPTRAVAVYAACALAGSLLMLVALIGSPLPATGLDLVAAVSCAGVPLLSFLTGHLVLGRWGRPVLGGEAPPGRYVPLGFVICALVAPSLFCLYLVVFRLLT